VLVHGFTARLEEFLLQRETLRGRARTVLYDCRGHGRSRGQGRVQGATIDQLGRDLGEVLDAVAPRGRWCCSATPWAA
jgi:pimeloyl-ACP methyl ester carboxylesterase